MKQDEDFPSFLDSQQTTSSKQKKNAQKHQNLIVQASLNEYLGCFETQSKQETFKDDSNNNKKSFQNRPKTHQNQHKNPPHQKPAPQYPQTNQPNYKNEDNQPEKIHYIKANTMQKKNPDSYYQYEDRIYYQPNNNFCQRSSQIVKVLMVAEKPSIAKSLADALSEGTSKHRQGYSKYLPVHEFQGKIFNMNAFIKITSVAGHVYGLNFTQEYLSWDRTDPIALFKATTIKSESNPQQKVTKHLEQEARDCQYLVLWLDNDREGENICFEVKSICERFMAMENNKCILRAKFSSLTRKDLKQAYLNIKDGPNLNECLAVDARQIIDLKVGVAFSRFQTTYFRQKYPDLNDKMISFGPCQTPTLGFCVAREDEIKNFKSKPYYKISISFLNKENKEIQAFLSTGNIQNQQEAQKLHSQIANQLEGKIESISSEKASKSRPEGLNTIQMLKIGSSYLHMSPQQTMHVAERLYLSGYITYPRTETTSYASGFNFEEIVKKMIGKDNTLGSYAQILTNNGVNRPKQGVDMGDHPPITPTTHFPQGGTLSGEEYSLFSYVCKHFLASISQDCNYLKVSIGIQVQDYLFKCNGIQIIHKGFLEIMDSMSFGENYLANTLQKGNIVKLNKIRLDQEFTTAPGYLTESELIGLMEKHKIGTDASLATHIQTICEREYVTISGNRTLVPSELGRCLIHGYQIIDEQLVLPDIRSQIENSVDQIAKGIQKFENVLDTCLSLFEKKFINFIANFSKIDVLFSHFYKNVEDTLDIAKPFSKCGQCKRFMKIIEKAGKIFCEKCQNNLLIPVGGKYKIIGEKYCPFDGYQVVFFTSANLPNVSFDLCPKCYTQSPMIDSDQVTCSICPNEKCDYSMNNRFLKNCNLCQVGEIVFEPQAAQKMAAMCNECWCQWCISINVKDIKINKEKCKKCLAFLVSFKYIVDKKNIQEKPVFSKELFENVCFFCEEDLLNEMKIVQYREPKKKYKKQHKGKK